MTWAGLEQALQRYRKSKNHPATRLEAGPYITIKFVLLTLCGLIASSCDSWIRLAGWIIAPASVVDSLLLNTSIAFCSFEEARPRSVLRSVVFAFATFWNIAIAFAVLYVLIGTASPFFPNALFFSILTVATIGGDRVASMEWPTNALVVVQLMTGLYFLVVILTTLVTWAGKKADPGPIAAAETRPTPPPARGFRCRISGLVLNFVGAGVVGVAGYEGLVTGYGSTGSAWLSPAWSATWLTGWVLFIIGFGLQVAVEVFGRRR